MVTEVMRLARRTYGHRGWLRWVLTAGTLVLAWALVSHFVPAPEGPAVRVVIVQAPPSRVLNTAQVRAAAANAVHGGMFGVDLAAVRRAVQRLPWVAGASVRRVWPDALAVQVTLRHPVARWGTAGLLDARGHVFTPASISAFAALPALSGPVKQASEVFADFIRADRQVQPLGLEISALHENARGGLRITFASGLVLVLGHRDPLARLARFVHIAVPALGPRLDRVATVDMRYPNGFAVGWKGAGEHGSKK